MKIPCGLLNSGYRSLLRRIALFALALVLALLAFPCALIATRPVSEKGAESLEKTASRQRSAVAANPDSAELHGELGRTLVKLSKYEEATGELGIAANQLPDSRTYNMALAEALLGWEHWGVAVDFLKAVQERFQQFPEFHYYLGLANFKLNKTPEAMPEFAEALRMNPNFDLAKFGLAACRATAGDLPGAAALSRELVIEHPQKARYWLALAQVLNSMGDAERIEALRAVRRAMALRPGNPEIELQAGVILIRLERYAAARPLLEHVVKLEPENSQAHVALTNTYNRLGQRSLARKESAIVTHLEEAKRLKPAAPPSPQE
jgi:predicted Zn-dependent protease